ncbi:protein Dok-7-like isoform X5 [Epinephelus moara]|uniref:protein Dok-7-like isoform X5 n=1 Tax=Epinephelus moara TaxID=300413 RepID=UPI00214E88B6|nr:protein Dok-7-like isoform X5 [Epinephelus moara]
MTDSVVVEGYARLRDGKKWKTRWLVLRKPSPVADCLLLLVFKDKSDKAQGNKERVSVTLEEICGLEVGQWYEGVAFTLAILCLNQAAILGFDSKEALLAWDARLRYSLGEVHRFSVGVLPGTKLESGPATLHLCNNLLALARDVPPVIIGHWNLPDLRRYGPVPNGFVFEGGTRCGYWAGVFLLASAESEQISFLFDCIVRGISPTRGPFGLRPVLPDPSASQTSSEERLNHEAQELEKRLSMLSHRSSTVSSSYCLSAGGDDRSISGSSDTSDTSQSDCSIGSRMAIWTEPASSPSENLSHVGAKAALQSIEKLSVNQGGGNRPAAKPPRQLQEIGRQSSSDSGIATGSHSSYSGSFSSYTGSLDIAPGEDFGSVFSLPPHLAQDLSPCSCTTVPGHEYQVPTSLRYLYDSPRSVLQEGGGGAKDNESSTPTKDTPASSGLTTDSAKGDKSSTMTSEGPSETSERASVSEHLQGSSEESKKTKVAPSSEHPDSCHICSPLTSVPKTIVTICSVCGGFKGTPHTPASGSAVPAIPDKRLNSKEERRRADPAYEIMESRGLERNSEAEEKSKYELMGSCGQQRFLQETEGTMFVFPPEAPLPERPRSDAVTYVNIPVSPTSKKQLNYMELELQEPGPSPRGSVAHLPAQKLIWTVSQDERPAETLTLETIWEPQLGSVKALEERETQCTLLSKCATVEAVKGKSSTKYAQIDITATETAHKVGTQHALGRQEGLHTLELRRKGTPH